MRIIIFANGNLPNLEKARALLRPDPYEIADRSAFETEETPVAASVREIVRRPRVTAAIGS